MNTPRLSRSAVLYRMVTNEHVCPYGLKTKNLLMRNGFIFEDTFADALNWVSAPLSVFKAVYFDKRELKCACVGGGSNVPLGLSRSLKTS